MTSSPERFPAIRVTMLPKDTNAYGTIFGGVILSYIDQAGALGGRREVQKAGGPLPFLVTVAVNRVEFKCSQRMLVVRGRENHSELIANQFEDFEAIELWHLYIQKDEVRLQLRD